MNAQVLIDSVVRQVTVLIAQLATSGGVRAPLAHIAHQVFLELATELEAQGVSRKVSADMFGMALRAYIRKVRRLTETQTERGRTLWQAVLDYLREEQLVSREKVLARFVRDDELSVSAVLRDLVESGVVFCSGAGRGAVYRPATDEELGRLPQLGSERGLDELLWVLIYRHGPMSGVELAHRLSRPPDAVAEIVERLVAEGRVRRLDDGRLTAEQFVISLGSTVGWEAAIFDHLQAVVQTICQRLGHSASGPAEADVVGGSTYSYDVWPGHPLEQEVKARLRAIRRELGGLRERVEAHNRQSELPATYQQVVTYVGQCILDRENPEILSGVEHEVGSQ
jgi:DNA-binding MarR family transcriptional regulator